MQTGDKLGQEYPKFLTEFRQKLLNLEDMMRKRAEAQKGDNDEEAVDPILRKSVLAKFKALPVEDETL